jgi:hypothetical protein
MFKRFAAGLRVVAGELLLSSRHEREQLPPLNHNDAWPQFWRYGHAQVVAFANREISQASFGFLGLSYLVSRERSSFTGPAAVD